MSGVFRPGRQPQLHPRAERRRRHRPHHLSRVRASHRLQRHAEPSRVAERGPGRVLQHVPADGRRQAGADRPGDRRTPAAAEELHTRAPRGIAEGGPAIAALQRVRPRNGVLCGIVGADAHVAQRRAQPRSPALDLLAQRRRRRAGGPGLGGDVRNGADGAGPPALPDPRTLQHGRGRSAVQSRRVRRDADRPVAR